MSMIGDNSKVHIDFGRLSETDKNKLRGAVKELSNSFTRQEAERDLQKSIVDAMNETIGIEKKVLKSVAKAIHKQNVAEVKEGHSRFDEAYEALSGPASDVSVVFGLKDNA